LKLLMLLCLAATNCILGEAKKGRRMDAKHEIADDELSTAARGKLDTILARSQEVKKQEVKKQDVKKQEVKKQSRGRLNSDAEDGVDVKLDKIRRMHEDANAKTLSKILPEWSRSNFGGKMAQDWVPGGPCLEKNHRCELNEMCCSGTCLRPSMEGIGVMCA